VKYLGELSRVIIATVECSVPNLFTEQLLVDASLRVTPQGLEFDVRLPWYRSLPLSTVEIAELRIDGRAIPADAISLQVNERQHGARDLADQVDDWWYVLDPGRVRVLVPDLGPSPGAEIELAIHLYPPYIPGLQWVIKNKKSLRASALLEAT
jgi:hypothetical protein